MNRRRFLGRLGTAATPGGTVALAGCSAFDSCGPGEDSVATLGDAVATDDATSTTEEVSLKGRLRSHSEEAVVIDDTTGTARLVSPGGFRSRNLEGGECVEAAGYPIGAGEGTDADVEVLVTDVRLAEN